MKYFVAAYRHAVEGEVAEIGEIVMPDVSPGSHSFLSLESGKPSPCAMVMELDRDPDEVFGLLTTRYPGIPGKLLNTWFTSTMVRAGKLPDSSELYSVETGPTHASVLAMSERKSYSVWADVVTTKYTA